MISLAYPLKGRNRRHYYVMVSVDLHMWQITHMQLFKGLYEEGWCSQRSGVDSSLLLY